MDYNSFTDDYPYSVLLARLGEGEESAKGIEIAQQLQQEQPNSSCRTRSDTPDLPMDEHETRVRRLQALYVGSRCQRGQISMADRPPARRNSLHTEVGVRQRDRFPHNMSYHYSAA